MDEKQDQFFLLSLGVHLPSKPHLFAKLEFPGNSENRDLPYFWGGKYGIIAYIAVIPRDQLV
jgi:hypothetical protein